MLAEEAANDLGVKVGDTVRMRHPRRSGLVGVTFVDSDFEVTGLHPYPIRNFVYMDIVPNTYILPGDYTIFVEEFRRKPDEMWIMKPTNRQQGKGIFLVNKLNQLRKWATNSKLPF